MVWGFSLADLFMRHDLGGWSKAGWLLVIVFFPILGTVFYFIFRPAVRRYSGYRDFSMAGDRLSLLSELRASGVITQEEYDRSRAAMLGNA